MDYRLKHLLVLLSTGTVYLTSSHYSDSCSPSSPVGCLLHSVTLSGLVSWSIAPKMFSGLLDRSPQLGMFLWMSILARVDALGVFYDSRIIQTIQGQRFPHRAEVRLGIQSGIFVLPPDPASSVLSSPPHILFRVRDLSYRLPMSFHTSDFLASLRSFSQVTGFVINS